VVATLVGVLVAGLRSGPEWIRIAITEPVPDVLDNAALPGLTLRLGITSAVGSALGAVLLIGTFAWYWQRTRRFGVDPVASVAHGTDPAGTAPWAVVAAGLLFSPIAWHNYLLLLLPGLLVLVAAAPAGSPRRAWGAVLLVIPVIPVSWGDLWTPENPWSPVGRSLYCAILLAYWFTLVRPGAQVRSDRADARV
jgi:alpha-1,2-mannosyltransferase